MNDYMGTMDGPMMGAMMLGGGLIYLLTVAALVLGIVALVKYIWRTP
ncbi:hypothetical protein [Abyssibius alkaniclasticus]|tara:strand:- start:676 stop:816 length:141 start_codon:yes stop_codon:yes gene_type:complete